jgi:hypothetical protein
MKNISNFLAITSYGIGFFTTLNVVFFTTYVDGDIMSPLNDGYVPINIFGG